MLVLTRKINESIVIGGNIRVTMTAIHNRQVRLAIDAPPEVRVMRQELVSEPDGDLDGERAPQQASRVGPDGIRRLRGSRP